MPWVPKEPLRPFSSKNKDFREVNVPIGGTIIVIYIYIYIYMRWVQVTPSVTSQELHIFKP